MEITSAPSGDPQVSSEAKDLLQALLREKELWKSGEESARNCESTAAQITSTPGDATPPTALSSPAVESTRLSAGSSELASSSVTLAANEGCDRARETSNGHIEKPFPADKVDEGGAPRAVAISAVSGDVNLIDEMVITPGERGSIRTKVELSTAQQEDKDCRRKTFDEKIQNVAAAEFTLGDQAEGNSDASAPQVDQEPSTNDEDIARPLGSRTDLNLARKPIHPSHALINATTAAEIAQSAAPDVSVASALTIDDPSPHLLASKPETLEKPATIHLKRKASASAGSTTKPRRKTKKGKEEEEPWRKQCLSFRLDKIPGNGSCAETRVAGSRQDTAEQRFMVFKQNPSRSRRANTVPSQEGPPSSSSATISSNRHVQPPSGGQKSAFASFQGLDVSTPSLRGPPQAQAQRSLTQHLPGPATVSAGPVYLTAANSNHLMANAGVQGQMPYLGAQTYGGPYSGYATGANLNVPSLAHNTSVTATPNSGLPAHYHNGGGYNGVGQFTPYSHNAHGYNAQASGASRGVVSYPVGNVPQSFAPAPPALAPPTHQLQAPATSFDFGQSTYSTTPSSSTVAPSFGATSSSTAPSSTTASQYYYPYTDYGVYGSGPR